VEIFGAILAIGLLIIVHESGHFLVARWCKMRVDRFSLGFGPALVKWRRGGTDFQLSPIPFGGYVQIAGMTIAEEVDPNDATAYPNRPVWQRFVTILAGPGTNYLFAVVLAFGLFVAAGAPTGTVWWQVSGTSKGYDAHGKLLVGDRILRINDRLIYQSFESKAQQSLPEIVRAEMNARGVPVEVTVLRDGHEVTIPITPKLHVGEASSAFFQRILDRCGEKCHQFHLGVVLDSEVERRHVGVLTSAGLALEFPVRQTVIIVDNLHDWATGRVEGELTGPVGITTAIKHQFQFGWVRVIQVLMLLNVYLGLFNLFPLPALDGGRLVFLGYEMATRRRANPKIEATVHMVGIMVLLLVMVVVTYNDIARLF
jgi:regulator of sigma E protease